MGFVAAAAIGGAATLGGAMISSNAADKASQQQAQSAQAALTQQKQMFDVAQGALQPYYQGPTNSGAETTLGNLLSPGQSAQQLSQMPGFQFQSTWGTKAAQNTLAAEGLGGSTGPLAKAVSDYNNGLAGTYYQNTTNALQQFINSGSGAAGALAGNATATGTSEANTQQAIGNAQASGTLGSANAIASGLSGAGSSASNALLLSTLMGNGGNGSIYGGSNSGLSSLFSTAPGAGFGSFG